MYMQADVKVGDEYGVKVGEDVVILNGTSIIPISVFTDNNEVVEDITSSKDVENDREILTIEDALWNEAKGLQDKLTEIRRINEEQPRKENQMSIFEANVKIDGLLAFEAFPGIYVQEDGKIQLKEAAERASLSFEDSTGTFEVPTRLLNSAEDLHRTQRRRDELTANEAPKK